MLLQLKFHAVDLLLKIVEHDLDREDDRAAIASIFMCVACPMTGL